ncbi:MAG: cache domain-containing protein [Hyphomonadaceae bacterium]
MVTSPDSAASTGLLSEVRTLFSRRSRVALALALITSVVLTSWSMGQWFAAQATDTVHRRADVSAALHAASLQSDLEKFRTLPFVLAQDPDVRSALAGVDRAPALNQKLESLASEVRAAVVYLLDANGVTLAASNWREETSFVGQNYGFRPYFRRAMADGYAELYALGTVSGEPGLYLARRVNRPGGGAGVIVVKVVFDAIEAQWANGDESAFVTDERGVVLITSEPEWRFQTLAPIPPEEIPALRESRQYGADATLAPLAPPDEHRFLAISAPVSSGDWRLHLLAPLRPTVSDAKVAGQVIGALATLLLWGAGIALYSLRRRAERERARQEAARRELELRVAERTSALETANTQLLHEMDERRRAESNVHLMQDELVQANKLAVLGQISAGVAHEINQPVTAIRAYVDNAADFIQRGETSEATENLGIVAALTERIGAITNELRSFSRKAASNPQSLRVVDAIDGALLLVSARTRARGVAIERRLEDENIKVVADRMRLEQVIVNLLQNALDALADIAKPRILVQVSVDEGMALLTIADNGPGLSDAVMAALFQPFVTTKDQGLGLGLVISRDICAEFGGVLCAARSELGGAAFVISIPVGS